MADYRDYEWEAARAARRAEEQKVKNSMRRERTFKDLVTYLREFPEDAELLRKALGLDSTTPDVVE